MEIFSAPLSNNAHGVCTNSRARTRLQPAARSPQPVRATRVLAFFDSYRSRAKEEADTMGDDLGDDWGVKGFDQSEDGTSSVAAEAGTSTAAANHWITALAQ